MISRLVTLCTLLGMLLASPSWAQVAHVAGDAEGEGATGISLSMSPSGSNRALYCIVTQAPGGGADVDAVSATFNTSESMTVIHTDTTTNSNRHIRIFRRTAPTATTANVVFTWAGGNHMRAICAAYSGVDQTTPEDAVQTTDGTSGNTSSSVNVSSATGDMVMDAVVSSAGAVFTVGAGQTEINQMTTDTGAGHQGIASSYESGSTTTTMSWALGATLSYVAWGWNINAAAGTAANTGQYRRRAQ